jgi:copper/silver efflux system protein
MLNRIILFFLENKLVTVLLLVLLVGWGLMTIPFRWETDLFPRDQVSVDAIPDIGENQQIVFTKWMGRSPQDVEDQITYPLTTSLLGLPSVKTVRSTSMFGFSSIYIIFHDDVDFYFSRTRILEKLNSLPQGTLPKDVQPQLGPDATALGQIYWYTLEGRDKEGNPAGGWDPQELRSIQDFYVKYALTSSPGVSEVASVGGYVMEYHIDVDPTAMNASGISLMDVVRSVKSSNIDVGAQTIEINRVEYFVRGLGYVSSVEDIEASVVKVRDNIPIRISDIARVSMGPATRRGALDKTGAEAVGGVVVARYGDNPLEVIDNVKKKIAEISKGLPERILEDGTVSKVTVVPFYDRSDLIYETLGTLEEALSLEILITIIVVIVMVLNLRASLLISSLLPVAVLMVFIAMRYAHVDANIVALSGIAIAIGTMVDMGIILVENMIRHLEEEQPNKTRLQVIYEATAEVSSAILTAIATTIVSFIPVFTMEAAEGKLFIPLAFTKTFALLAAVLVSLIILPAFAHWFLLRRKNVKTAMTGKRYSVWFSKYWGYLLIGTGLIVAISISTWGGIALMLLGGASLARGYLQGEYAKYGKYIQLITVVLIISFLLGRQWLPLGPENSLFVNVVFILLILTIVLGVFSLFIRFYKYILAWCLEHKAAFLSLVGFAVFLGINVWLGFASIFGFIAQGTSAIGLDIQSTSAWQSMDESFPGVGREFMPALDEGAFLLMPTSMPHAGMEQNSDVVKRLDMAVAGIPEIETVVGKLGRVESPLDPAPASMYENLILYKSEFVVDKDGNRLRFKVDDDGEYERDSKDELIPDDDGKYYRNWREHIHSPDDIWDEIVKASAIPGVTSAPKLQPIQTRLVMLQTGMRAPMGIKVFGPDLESIEEFALKLEKELKNVKSIKTASVFADRIVGKPYVHLEWNRDELARYGLSVQTVQQYVEVALGGIPLTTTVDGRERYSVRVRYPRELRDSPASIERVLISTPVGVQIPLRELAEIKYERGPQMIKSEDTFLVGYVIFDKVEGRAEVDVVNDAQAYLNHLIDNGALAIPNGVSYRFTGNYENSLRAEKRLSFVVPLSLLIIWLILYFQFRSVALTFMIFSSILVAFSGGFILIWLYGQGWFMDFSLFGENMRDLFQMKTINLSVAVWVGFIALFGIASDDGVVMATYLKQVFQKSSPANVKEVRAAVVEAGMRRVRPCLMTTATTLLALLPVLSSTGRGSDIMAPMAIPSFGGMTIALLTLFVIPVLYSWYRERKLKYSNAVEGGV